MFDEITGRAHFRKPLHVFIIAVGGKDKHLAGGAFLVICRVASKPLSEGITMSINTKLAEAAGQVHSLPAGFGFAHDFQIRFGGQKRAQTLPHNHVVINQ